MNKLNLIKVSNYPLSYPEAVKRGVSFIERGESTYPFSCYEITPECISLLGKGDKPDLLLLGSYRMNAYSYQAAKLFAFECMIAGIKIALRCRNGLDNALFSFFRNHKYPLSLFIPEGVLSYRSRNKVEMNALLSNGGSLISPFEPNEERSVISLSYVDEMLTNIPDLVFFGLSSIEYTMALSALDKGCGIFLHSAALSYRNAQKLALEGAPVIEHVNLKGYAFWDERGEAAYLPLTNCKTIIGRV